MKKSDKTYIIVHLILQIFIIVFAGGKAEAKRQEPIVYIDMRYTLKTDYKDSMAVIGVWDDLHTISALQGIVNRDKPRLYIEYVVTNGRSIDAYWWNRYRRVGSRTAGLAFFGMLSSCSRRWPSGRVAS